MTRVRVRMNSKGARQLLRSVEVQRDLRERTRRIAARAGEGMYSEVETGPNRARGEVRTGTRSARKREASSKSLTSALDAGR